MANEFDSLYPNSQTPPNTSQLGSTSRKWDDINVTAGKITTLSTTTLSAVTFSATTTSGTTVGAGSAMYLEGTTVAKTFRVSDNIEASGKIFTHPIGTQHPIVQVWDGNASGVPFGSGSPGVSPIWIDELIGISTTQMVIVPSAAISGATIRIVG